MAPVFLRALFAHHSKFLSDDWMREHGFLDEAQIAPDRFHGATVADLDLPAPITCSETTSCAEAVELLHKHGFEYMPLMTPDGKVCVRCDFSRRFWIHVCAAGHGNWSIGHTHRYAVGAGMAHDGDLFSHPIPEIVQRYAHSRDT